MTDLIYSSVTRITGEDELVAVSVDDNCNAKRMAVQSVERGDSIAHAAVSVAQTAVILKVGAQNLQHRRSLLIQNQGPKSIFIGGSSVTVSNGIEVFLKSSIVIDISELQSIYAISASGTQNVRVMEVS